MCLFGLKKIFIEFKIIPSILKWEKENIGEHLYDLGLGKNFLAKTPKSWSHEKKNKLGSRKIKNLCFLEDTVRRMKDESWIGGKELKLTYLIKDRYTVYRKNSENSIIWK